MPSWEPRYTGKPDDVVALAEWLYPTHRALSLSDLADALGRPVGARLPELLDAGWCFEGEAWDQLVPEADYVAGHLWPKLDRAETQVATGKAPQPHVALDRIEAQARKLRDAIQPCVLDAIEGVSARQVWGALALLAKWMGETFNHHYQTLGRSS